ncbi:glycosyltransferase family 4 protein [Enterococcus faecalis]|nr:glycosyltransferase family 4 protein [Enterococcus faecalis]EGO8860052.1 glycosyltransferase [Enterococcus faecalis]EHH1657727.1 glycosyltransferase family 4 protein [Enterococcus faecalis]EHZ5578671.1 glycosyltransferase family 4 protein [Enterococcus faecalis]
MKILMIGPSNNSKGGMASVIKLFQESSFQITYLESWHEKGWVICFITLFFKLRKLIKKHEIEIVHFHVAQNGSFFRKSLLLFLVPKNMPAIFHMHASNFTSFYDNAGCIKKYWIKKTFQKVDLIVAVSRQWKEYYETITETRVQFVNNSVIVSKDDYFSFRSKRVITLGRIGNRKGSYDILEAASKIYKIDPAIKFELYGDGEVLKFQELSEKIPNVSINNWISHKNFKETLMNSSLHLLPSYNEGLPMSVLETMGMGIPNITSDVGGIPTVINSEENGWLIKAGEVDEIVSVILKILTFGEQLAIEKVASNAKETIKNEFGIHRYFEIWLQIYLSVK